MGCNILRISIHRVYYIHISLSSRLAATQESHLVGLRFGSWLNCQESAQWGTHTGFSLTKFDRCGSGLAKCGNEHFPCLAPPDALKVSLRPPTQIIRVPIRRQPIRWRLTLHIIHPFQGFYVVRTHVTWYYYATRMGVESS